MRCKLKKKEDEVLQLCLPVRPPACKVFTPCVASLNAPFPVRRQGAPSHQGWSLQISRYSHFSPAEGSLVRVLGPSVRQVFSCHRSLPLGSTDSHGCHLQFVSWRPCFSGVVHSQALGELAFILQEEISPLISKGVVCVVLSALCQSSF